MRQARIFYKDELAGILTENDAGYEFRYLQTSTRTVMSASARPFCNTYLCQKWILPIYQ